MTMTGIPTSILKQLRQAFLQCDDYFASNSSLRDLFSDETIHPFRTGLPERDSVNGRIEATIAHLANKQRADGRNALVLFLHVLSDKYAETDQRHTALQHLATQLPTSTTRHSPLATPHSPLATSPTWNTAAIRQLLSEALDDQSLTDLAFDHFRPVYDQFSIGLTRNHKIQLLIEYCQRHNQIEALLNQIQHLNPAQYHQHQPHLTHDT
jgi:uncharacterized protein (DUF924 family)